MNLVSLTIGLATLSNSSLFLIAKLLEDTLLALINSSARHSAIDLIDLNDASLVPVHQPYGLIDTSKRCNIYSLSTDSTSTTNTSAIFTWCTIYNSINKNLQWVFSS